MTTRSPIRSTTSIRISFRGMENSRRTPQLRVEGNLCTHCLKDSRSHRRSLSQVRVWSEYWLVYPRFAYPSKDLIFCTRQVLCHRRPVEGSRSLILCRVDVLIGNDRHRRNLPSFLVCTMRGLRYRDREHSKLKWIPRPRDRARESSCQISYSSSSSTGRLALARILSATSCGTMS